MEELLEMLESTANLLRGMTFDTSIPSHAKAVMAERAGEINKITEKYAYRDE